MQLPRADHQVDVRGPLEDQLLVFLGHAAQHADDLVGMALFDVLQPAQGAVDLVFGVLADAAGVEQDRVGLLRRVDQLVAFVRRLATTSSLSSMFIWQPTVSMYSLRSMVVVITALGTRRRGPSGRVLARTPGFGFFFFLFVCFFAARAASICLPNSASNWLRRKHQANQDHHRQVTGAHQ